MPDEQKFDYGITGEESKKAEEWISKNRPIGRRDFIKMLIALGSPIALYFLCNWLPKISGLGSVDNPLAGNSAEQQREATISWITLMREKNASSLWNSIDLYKNNLNPQSQRLTDFNSIEQTQLGTALSGYKDFINDLRTAEGRKLLRAMINQQQGKMDTQGYKDLVDKFEDYASKLGGDVEVDKVGEFFTNSDYGLGYPTRDWEFMKGVYTAVTQRDGNHLSGLMTTYKTTTPIPSR